jgi:hypothetical protein
MAPETPDLPVTWARTLSVWWCLLWRGLVLGALAGAIVGAVAGLILALLGRASSAGEVGQILGALVALPVSLWVVRSVLRKTFRGFAIRLVPPSSSEPSRTAVRREI